VAGSSANGLLDSYVGGGGRILDTAAVYKRGESERILSDWLRLRGGRDDLIIVTKGGHPGDDWRTRLTAPEVRTDLTTSLHRLGIGAVDVYLLHRDDESRPVSELVDVLLQIKASGLARWVGVSNWRTARIKEALAGTPPIDLVSNYFGLGIPEGPPLLPGVVSSFDADGQQLLRKAGVPMLAWSAMSTGFFADPRRPSDLSDACAANPESVRRREILHSVAADHGQTTEAIHIRWLATAAKHLFPVISSSRPDRISALMKAAGDSGLDPAVADLVAQLAPEHSSPVLRSLLLPRQMPEW
jgi:aryl-alcohol dehydrogenase-like predicted oxidoreductase